MCAYICEKKYIYILSSLLWNEDKVKESTVFRHVLLSGNQTEGAKAKIFIFYYNMNLICNSASNVNISLDLELLYSLLHILISLCSFTSHIPVMRSKTILYAKRTRANTNRVFRSRVAESVAIATFIHDYSHKCSVTPVTVLVETKPDFCTNPTN